MGVHDCLKATGITEELVKWEAIGMPGCSAEDNVVYGTVQLVIRLVMVSLRWSDKPLE